MENQLEKIGKKYKNTDKLSLHGYHRFYDYVLRDWRDKTFTMLEIGVEGGSSLDMWKEYFPHAFLYGIDMNHFFCDDRVCIFHCDQSKPDDLQKAMERIGKRCPIILDDGSHIPEHQILTFDTFFTNLLEEGGIYIIEDIETSYWKRNGLYGYKTEYGYLHPKSCVEYFKHMVDFINKHFCNEEDKAKIRETLGVLRLETLNAISSITFGDNCIIIRKKLPYEYEYSKGRYQFAENV
jgi:hypothetical protein